MEKLYGFDSFFSIGKIEEYDIIKETPKTYTIQRQGGGFERVIRKNEMSVGQTTYATSFREAVRLKKEKIDKRIEAKYSDIKRTELEIDKLKHQRKEIEKWEAENL